MIEKITLTNFQRHRALEVNFSAGITALRGANENGKSTLIRGICYALFGAKSTGFSLAELVTWGEPEGSLKVEIVLSVEGDRYTIKRGKSGAELQAVGLMVTGQNDVTDFVSKLLKVDPAAATRLMLANQNEIRGALESGTKATTELIEQLAEFDQIDNLIELMQEKLVLGNSGAAEASLTAAQVSLDAARAAATPVNEKEHEGAIATLRDSLSKADQALEAGQQRSTELAQALGTLKEAALQRSNAQGQVDSANARVVRADKVLLASLAVAAPPEGVPLEKLRERLAQLADMGKVLAAHKAVAPHLGAPEGETFEGTLSSLEVEISLTRTQQEIRRSQVATEDRNAAMARVKISLGSCTTCGQDISSLPQVAQQNADLEAKALGHDSLAITHQAAAEELNAYLVALEDVRERAMPRIYLLRSHPDYLRAVGDEIPATLKWIGGEIPDVVGDEAEGIKQAIAQHEADQRAYDAAQGRVEQASSEKASAEVDSAAALALLATLPEADPSKISGELAAAQALRPALAGAQRAAQRELGEAENALANAKQDFARAVQAASDAEKVVAERKQGLEELAFNNALLKRVRQARPLIADKLWGMTLAAVSRYFSEMRGQVSVVTKDGDGFKVDGHIVHTLSGSTLDILGLAIRVALTRTFLPTAPLLVLDEPFHGCDDERTALSLGFLSGLGMSQVLLVTHEEISDSVADSVIEI